MTDDIAVGVPVFSRTLALEQLLSSVPSYVSTVYVADNGRCDDYREAVYAADWPFDLQVINLEYDVGIGACRSAIADAVDEHFLWVGDSDMELVRRDDLKRLRDILQANPGLGGVSGWLLEGDTIRAGAKNLQMHGDAAVKTVESNPNVEDAPLPFARFDFIPQCGLFRTEVFATYSYDPDIFNSEHLDFFAGHKAADEWSFASTPAVLVRHHRDIDPEYRDSKRGKNHVDFDRTSEKWGIADDVERAAAVADWDEIVGEEMARRTRPVGIREGTVFVEVESASWMQELNMMRHEILRRINAGREKGRVEKIVFLQAGRSEGSGSSSDRKGRS